MRRIGLLMQVLPCRSAQWCVVVVTCAAGCQRPPSGKKDTWAPSSHPPVVPSEAPIPSRGCSDPAPEPLSLCHSLLLPSFSPDCLGIGARWDPLGWGQLSLERHQRRNSPFFSIHNVPRRQCDCSLLVLLRLELLTVLSRRRWLTCDLKIPASPLSNENRQPPISNRAVSSSA